MARIRKKLCCIDVRGVGTDAWPRETVSAGPASAYCRSRQLLRHCSAALLVAIKLAGFSKSIVGESEVPFIALPFSADKFVEGFASRVEDDESCHIGLSEGAWL